MNVISLHSDAGYCPLVPNTLTLTGHVAVALRRCMETRLACQPPCLLTGLELSGRETKKGYTNLLRNLSVFLKQVEVFPTRNSLTFSDALGHLSNLTSQSFSLRHTPATPFSSLSICGNLSSVIHLFTLSLTCRTATLIHSVSPIGCPLSKFLT